MTLGIRRGPWGRTTETNEHEGNMEHDLHELNGQAQHEIRSAKDIVEKAEREKRNLTAIDREKAQNHRAEAKRLTDEMRCGSRRTARFRRRSPAPATWSRALATPANTATSQPERR